MRRKPGDRLSIECDRQHRAVTARIYYRGGGREYSTARVGRTFGASTNIAWRYPITPTCASHIPTQDQGSKRPQAAESATGRNLASRRVDGGVGWPNVGGRNIPLHSKVVDDPTPQCRQSQESTCLEISMGSPLCHEMSPQVHGGPRQDLRVANLSQNCRQLLEYYPRI